MTAAAARLQPEQQQPPPSSAEDAAEDAVIRRAALQRVRSAGTSRPGSGKSASQVSGGRTNVHSAKSDRSGGSRPVSAVSQQASVHSLFDNEEDDDGLVYV